MAYVGLSKGLIVRFLSIAAVALIALSATAKPVGYVSTSAVTIVIHDDQGKCPDGLKQATWVQQKGVVAGCYWERDGILFFGWEDMDVHAIPARVFKRPGA